MTTELPLVSVVTPVYNGGRYLAECIRSVLNQTYENWEYVIVDNCSTDETLRIAEQYAGQDPRIRVHRNTSFLSMPDNWNYAVRQIGTRSKYCKIVHADDWMFEECLEKMVKLAEANPEVGIVGSYIQEGDRVGGDGLPFPSNLNPGKAVCRDSLMGKVPYLFGSPSALLIRADAIRLRSRIYNDRYHQLLDQTACYDILKNADFGFVHQVLTFHRMHGDSQTTRNEELNKLLPEQIQFLKEYGPYFLSEKDLNRRIDVRLQRYYQFLARSKLAGKDETFWSFHQEKLKELGCSFNGRHLIYAIIEELYQFFRRVVRFPMGTIRDYIKNGEIH